MCQDGSGSLVDPQVLQSRSGCHGHGNHVEAGGSMVVEPLEVDAGASARLLIHINEMFDALHVDVYL